MGQVYDMKEIEKQRTEIGIRDRNDGRFKRIYRHGKSQGGLKKDSTAQISRHEPF